MLSLPASARRLPEHLPGAGAFAPECHAGRIRHSALCMGLVKLELIEHARHAVPRTFLCLPLTLISIMKILLSNEPACPALRAKAHENDAPAHAPEPISSLSAARIASCSQPCAAETTSQREWPFARKAAIAAENEQPVPCVFRVSGVAPASAAYRCVPPECRALAAGQMTALHQHRLRAQRPQSLALNGHFARFDRRRSIQQARRFGKDSASGALPAAATERSLTIACSARRVSPDLAIITGQSRPELRFRKELR